MLDASTSAHTSPDESGSPDVILRFQRSERNLHWAIAVPFMVCYGTALVLWFVYNPDPQRPYRDLFSWVHRISGACLLLFPLWALIRNREDFRTHLHNIRQAWVWTFSDIRWLAMMGPAAVSKRFRLPDQGKFNAAEKINFMMVMTTFPLYIVTGILLWLPGAAFLAWLLHVGMAALATPLLFGHIFMATVNPGTRIGLPGMISGFVDRMWAKHHYAAWYREVFESDEPIPVLVSRTQIFMGCRACGTGRVPVKGFSLSRIAAVESVPCPPCPTCAAELQTVTILAEPAELEWILEELDRGGAGFVPADGLPDPPGLPMEPVPMELVG